MITSVIIDFDDTLCMTELACFELENAALQLMGREPQKRELHQKTWGQPLYDAIKVRSPGIDLEEFREVIEEMRQLWVAENKVDAISTHSFGALDSLLSEGKELYILTSRTHDELKHLLAPDHELATRIKAFYYRDNMVYVKPDPRAFDELLSDHNLQPHESVYIGDSPTDAMAAKQAGLHFIASLESGLRTKEDFATLPVDKFINTFAELPKAIASL